MSDACSTHTRCTTWPLMSMPRMFPPPLLLPPDAALPQTEMLVVTTPAKGAQKVAARVADMARRSYLKVLGILENMSEFVAPDGSRHAIFGRGGGDRLATLTGAPLVGRVPIEATVSTG